MAYHGSRRRQRFGLMLWTLSVMLASCQGGPSGPGIFPRQFAPLLPEGGSVYFVGNSFLGWEGRNLPEWLAALGKAQGVEFDVGADISPGDRPLADFLGHPAIRNALKSRRYEVWIVQAHELEPIDHPEAFKKAVKDFDAAIKESGGQMVLFMTWEFRWRKMMPELADDYESLGRELRLPIIPAGLVFLDCERSPPSGFDAFFLTASPEAPKGGLHENKFGMAANAYITFQILTGRNPHGQGFVAPGNDIGPEMSRYLSDRAWERAIQRLKVEKAELIDLEDAP